MIPAFPSYEGYTLGPHFPSKENSNKELPVWQDWQSEHSLDLIERQVLLNKRDKNILLKDWSWMQMVFKKNGQGK